MDGIRAIACQPLFGPLHYEPEGPKHPPPSGDFPLTQPRKSVGSRTARDAFSADQRGYCGLETCDRRPSCQTTGTKGNIEVGVRVRQGYSHANAFGSRTSLVRL